MLQFKFAKNRVPLGIIEIMENGVEMELNCELTRQVVDALQANNIDCYIVGGYVRDHLVGIKSKDIDIELHNTTIEEAYQVVRQVAEAKVFGSFGVISLTDANTEFAIARTEKKTGSAHTDFEVEFITDGNLKLAASRRDFTINSIMYDLQTNKLIDNYNGITDLENKILRHVGPAFAEDPLRILRGIKFMARYNLQIDNETNELCKSIINELRFLPTIRVQNEIEAIFSSQHFKQVNSLLSEYFSLLFKDRIEQVTGFNTDSDYNRLMFFKQFTNYEQVIDFCYEQKTFKKDLKLTLENYDQYINFEKLSGETRYGLLANSKHHLKYISHINPIVLNYYDKYVILTSKYNGQYFMNLGIQGKAIKEAMKTKIGDELNEL